MISHCNIRNTYDARDKNYNILIGVSLGEIVSCGPFSIQSCRSCYARLYLCQHPIYKILVKVRNSKKM